MSPAAKRGVVQNLVKRGKRSQRRACALVEVPRATARYKRRVRSDEVKLRKRIRQLAKKHTRYGVRRILAMLRREGWRLNKKRVHRLWKQEGLQRKRKRKRKRACGPGLSPAFCFGDKCPSPLKPTMYKP